jgi:membrane protein
MEKSSNAFQKKSKDIISYFKSEVWKIPLDELTKGRSFLIKFVRVNVLAVRSFIEDEVKLRASAFTYYTLFSMVPAIAMAFAIAKGFGLEKAFEKQLSKNISGQEQIIKWIIRFSNNMLEIIKGGWIAGIGILILFWAIMNVLGNIEESFNGIWQVKKSRGITRKFTDYLSIITVATVLFILSSSVSVFITTQLKYLAIHVHIKSYNILSM